MFTLGYLKWDPSPAIFEFSLPFLNRPILWYGFFFAFGFFLGYWVLVSLLRRYFLLFPHYCKVPQCASKVAERLTLYVVIGALIGARLGDLLFYQNWTDILRDPWIIIEIWKGGLASHGGALGILAALWVFSRKTKMPFWRVVDFVVVPTAIAAVCIRIGNFFNQEILGIPTSLPWGIIFLHPVDGGPIVPRHPAQLYEAIAYLCIFFALFIFARKNPSFERKGKLTGLFLIFVFSFRFLIEFLKVEQSEYLRNGGMLTMGQWLSIPFIFLGVYLFCKRK